MDTSQSIKRMDIKKAIYNFSIKNKLGFQRDNLTPPCEIIFPPRSPKHQVLISKANKEICFDLIYYKTEELRQFKLMASNLISDDYLRKLSIEFSFEIKTHPLAENLSIGVIPKLPKQYGFVCYGAIRKSDDEYFLMIYSLRGSTNFEEDIIYVYGIWEVNLPKEIEVELFSTAL